MSDGQGDTTSSVVVSVLAGEWRISAIRVGKEPELLPPIDNTSPTITFDIDEFRLSIDTGCNRVNAGWDLTANRLSVSAPMRTLMFCAEPPGLMEQEQALSDAIEAVATVTLNAGTLTLFAESEHPLIVASRT